MTDISLTRRKVVKALLALGVVGPYWHAFADDRTVMASKLPPVGDPDKPSFELFLTLSSLVTLREHLDPATARRIYDVFMDEPWGPQNMSACYGAVKKTLVNGRVDAKALNKDQSWFVSHLLTTWYLGVYYHEKRPTQRVAYETALMFDSTRGTLPIPFLQGTPYGEWSKPPKGAV